MAGERVLAGAGAAAGMELAADTECGGASGCSEAFHDRLLASWDIRCDSEPQRKIHNDRMLSAFWEELLENGGPLTNEEISIKIYNYRLDLDMTVPYLIVLFSVKYREGLSLRNEENLVQCIFRWENTGFFRVSAAISGIVVPMDRTMTVDMVIDKCEEYTRFLEDVWKYKMAVFIGEPLYMDKLTGHFNELIAMEMATVLADRQIYRYEAMLGPGVAYECPDLGLWRVLLEKGMYDRLYGDIKTYVNSRKAVMRRSHLNRFMSDFEQLVYGLLPEMGIELSLPTDELGEMIYVHRYDTVDNALQYIMTVFERLRLHASNDGAEHVSLKVKAYIRSHLDQELSRETLAACVHLNADYLGRLFKAECGLSLKDYVTRERMALAGALLANTDIPVSEAALRTGYHNFAHFSTAFRKYWGMSPLAYRQQDKIQ